MNPRIALVVLSCLISVVTGFTIARSGGGVAETGRTKAKPVIGLSMDTLKEERWQADREMFVKRAGELGVDVIVQSANSDDARQIKDIESLITSRVDVMVIVPHNGDQMAKGVELAHQAGIPVLSYDRLIRGCDLDLYMTFDNVRVGEAQGKYLVDHLPTPGKGRIVRIYGAKTDNNASLFKAGQDNILKPYIDRGDITVVHEDWAQDWKPESAKNIVQAAITANGSNIDAICASNDGTAGGAIQALTEEGLAGKILVTGQDAELAACQRILNGTQAMTIYKPVKNLASRAAEVASDMALRKVILAKDEVDNGKKMVPSILLDFYTVTKENMADTVVKDGFHTREEVYGASAAKP